VRRFLTFLAGFPPPFPSARLICRRLQRRLLLFCLIAVVFQNQQKQKRPNPPLAKRSAVTHRHQFKPRREVNPTASDSRFVIDRGWVSTWVRMCSMWLCCLTYLWTVIAPAVLRHREFSRL
jgi:hypothetical protein